MPEPREIDTTDEMSLRDALTFVRDNPGVMNPPMPGQPLTPEQQRIVDFGASIIEQMEVEES